MRLEKLPLKDFRGTVATDSARRPYVPPSLLPEPPSEQPTLPPEPVYSQADLKNAEQEGYRKGFLEGTKEGHLQAQSEQAEVNQLLTGVVEKLAEQMRALFADHNRFVAERREKLPPLALAIARKVAGDALREAPMTLVESTVTACLERLVGEPQVAITVNDKLSDALEERLLARFAGNTDPGEINIHGDPEVPPGDCRIEWSGGNASRSIEVLWQEAEALIENRVEAERHAGPPASAPLPALSPEGEPPAAETPNEGA